MDPLSKKKKPKIKKVKVYENYSMDWRITAIVESKIDEVIEN